MHLAAPRFSGDLRDPAVVGVGFEAILLLLGTPDSITGLTYVILAGQVLLALALPYFTPSEACSRKRMILPAAAIAAMLALSLLPGAAGNPESYLAVSIQGNGLREPLLLYFGLTTQVFMAAALLSAVLYGVSLRRGFRTVCAATLLLAAIHMIFLLTVPDTTSTIPLAATIIAVLAALAVLMLWKRKKPNSNA